MKDQITINWNEAQEISQQLTQEQEQERNEALKDFLSEDHALTDVRDLQFYADKTGKNILWLLENGKNINSYLKQYFLMGGSIDDAINTDFQGMEQKDQEYKICFYIERQNPETGKRTNEPIYNYEIEDYCGSYWDQLSQEDQILITEEFNKI